MHWTEFATYDDSNAATEKAFLVPGDLGQAGNQALCANERDNPKVRNVPSMSYTRHQIPPVNLAGIFNLIATVPFQHAAHILDCSESRSSPKMQWRELSVPKCLHQFLKINDFRRSI
jgi:hypothetical protein